MRMSAPCMVSYNEGHRRFCRSCKAVKCQHDCHKRKKRKGIK
jgi:hypothetical protein